MNKLSINNKGWQNIAGLIVIAMFFIGDRFLKQLALEQGYGQSINILGDWLQFNFAPNPYIAFSIPFGGILVNIISGFLITFLTIALISLIIKKRLSAIEKFLIILIIIGAISNFIDRLLYGFVIDYLDLKYFTIFNLADMMISGPIAFVIFNFKKYGNYGKNTLKPKG